MDYAVWADYPKTNSFTSCNWLQVVVIALRHIGHPLVIRSNYLEKVAKDLFMLPKFWVSAPKTDPLTLMDKQIKRLPDIWKAQSRSCEQFFFNNLECLTTFSSPMNTFIISSFKNFIEGFSDESKIRNLDVEKFLAWESMQLPFGNMQYDPCNASLLSGADSFIPWQFDI